jgi:hypothetical protein
MEISYASYARRVLEFLRANFCCVTILTFRKRLFQDLNEDTALLLADGKAQGGGAFYVRDLEDLMTLRYLDFDKDHKIFDSKQMDAVAIARGERRIIEHLLPESPRLLYESLRACDQVCSLAHLADVGIGYVTGANEFFHMDPDSAARWEIPQTYLRPAVRRGRSLKGVRFTATDWSEGLKDGETAYLLHIDRNTRIFGRLRDYLKSGEQAGVSSTYKCRNRSPWYTVPHVHEADAFLAVMSGAFPRMVANNAQAVATNSLHVVRLLPEANISSAELAILWQTSLTRLSAEIQGHSLGGGMLKLEPTEAERVLLPLVRLNDGQVSSLSSAVDRLLRLGRDSSVQDLVDELLLVRSLGLSRRECAILKEAGCALQLRRQNRSAEQ